MRDPHRPAPLPRRAHSRAPGRTDTPAPRTSADDRLCCMIAYGEKFSERLESPRTPVWLPREYELDRPAVPWRKEITGRGSRPRAATSENRAWPLQCGVLIVTL